MKFSQLIMLARSRDVPEMITIGSVESAPHMREIHSYRRCLPFSFLFFRNPTARTGIAAWTIMPQSTQISLKEMPLGVFRFEMKILGVIFDPKIEKVS
jgi:hypothetical protein